MTALQTRPAPPTRWEAAAICDPDIDYAAITTTRHPDYERAVKACSHCPVLEACRTAALAVVDMAGLAGGLLPGQRAAWRERHGVKVTTGTRDWLPADVAVRDSGRVAYRIPDHVVALVADLVADGLTSEEIARHTGLSVHTVKHCRNLAGGSRTRRPTS